MKLWPGALTILLLGGGFTAAVVISNRDNNHEKVSCTEISRDCELSKQHVVLKVIDGGGGVDNLGLPLENDRWYMYATKSVSLTRLRYSESPRNVFDNHLNIFLNGKKPDGILHQVNQFKADTITSFAVKDRNSPPVQVVNKVILFETDGNFFLEESETGHRLSYETSNLAHDK